MNKSELSIPLREVSCTIVDLFNLKRTLSELRIWEPYGLF